VFKVDLHTHSIISYDGGINEQGYRKVLKKGILDCIAVTDHNEIAFGVTLQKKLGEQIIVGEEIDTSEGQVIGLFLRERIAPGLSAMETCRFIRKQGGIVYIPHPFEKRRSGMKEDSLLPIMKHIAIIEVFNARGFLRGKPEKALAFAKKHKLAMASGSDAHGFRGLGTSYAMISRLPTAKTLVNLLHEGQHAKRFAPIPTLLTPKINKLKKHFAYE
jgi:predicted metal-dependent phosphoesterase TrpH